MSGAERHALRKELAAAERKMAKLEGQIAEVDAELASIAAGGDLERMTALDAQSRQLRAEHAEVEERWLELAETLEDA